MDKYIGEKVLARGIQSGVYFGTLAAREGQECELHNVRNIWRWRGANNLLDMANNGVDAAGDYNRISCAVDSIVLTDVCEIVPCTERAAQNLEGVAVWEYQREI